ncbi:hypothetical protein M5K25_008421 [Dendrobium thyrsiflorum]|uniref:Uncharacterized protein n=1 Tax=Dendrobium thyrsiflorum TaxID=117978 RepID=A0ABD0VFH8_DENTH
MRAQMLGFRLLVGSRDEFGSREGKCRRRSGLASAVGVVASAAVEDEEVRVADDDRGIYSICQKRRCCSGIPGIPGFDEYERLTYAPQQMWFSSRENHKLVYLLPFASSFGGLDEGVDAGDLNPLDGTASDPAIFGLVGSGLLHSFRLQTQAMGNMLPNAEFPEVGRFKVVLLWLVVEELYAASTQLVRINFNSTSYEAQRVALRCYGLPERTLWHPPIARALVLESSLSFSVPFPTQTYSRTLTAGDISCEPRGSSYTFRLLEEIWTIDLRIRGQDLIFLLLGSALYFNSVAQFFVRLYWSR